MPRISVISIAKNEEELDHLRRTLRNQTFRDYELITSTKGNIPEAWNDAISRASGDYLVFIESDASPLYDRWLEEVCQRMRRNAVLKGLEINPTDFDMCNLVCDASILKTVRFDESFEIAEDTELFARLRKMGVPIEHVSGFPVVHRAEQTWRKTLTRAFRRGMLYMKIIYLHGRNNIHDVNTGSFRANYIHPISNRIRIIVENVLVLLGLAAGAVRYLPVLLKQKTLARGARPHSQRDH
jgi:glycosyltransferase involved in cell wall biosynthesis